MTRREQAERKARRQWNHEAQAYLRLTDRKLTTRLNRMTNVTKLETLQKVVRHYGDINTARKVQLRKRQVVRGY